MFGSAHFKLEDAETFFLMFRLYSRVMFDQPEDSDYRLLQDEQDADLQQDEETHN